MPDIEMIWTEEWSQSDPSRGFPGKPQTGRPLYLGVGAHTRERGGDAFRAVAVVHDGFRWTGNSPFASDGARATRQVSRGKPGQQLPRGPCGTQQIGHEARK